VIIATAPTAVTATVTASAVLIAIAFTIITITIVTIIMHTIHIFAATATTRAISRTVAGNGCDHICAGMRYAAVMAAESF
jgi:hypothetical protein